MSACPRCSGKVSYEEKFCPSCGADILTELQISATVTPALDAARKWILAIGVLYLVSQVVMALMMRRELTSDGFKILIAIGAGLFVLHLGLWFWARKAPFAAAVVALVAFITLQLVGAVLDPSSLYKGLIIKVLFVVALTRAVRAGLEAQRMRRKLA